MSNRSIMLAPLLHPAPRSGEGGPPCAGRVVEGASDSNLARPHAPSTTLRAVPLPRTSCGGGQNEIVLATLSCARALPTTTTPKIDSLPAIKEGSGAPKGACHPCPRLRKQVYANLRHSSATRLRAQSFLPPCGESGRGHARLSALTLAALATGYHPDGSAPEPGFPTTEPRSVLPAWPFVCG